MGTQAVRFFTNTLEADRVISNESIVVHGIMATGDNALLSSAGLTIEFQDNDGTVVLRLHLAGSTSGGVVTSSIKWLAPNGLKVIEDTTTGFPEDIKVSVLYSQGGA